MNNARKVKKTNSPVDTSTILNQAYLAPRNMNDDDTIDFIRFNLHNILPRVKEMVNVLYIVRNNAVHMVFHYENDYYLSFDDLTYDDYIKENYTVNDYIFYQIDNSYIINKLVKENSPFGNKHAKYKLMFYICPTDDTKMAIIPGQ